MTSAKTREMDVEVQGVIELSVRCRECDEELEIADDGFTSKGVKVVKVRPCEKCLERESFTGQTGGMT